jgi:hypothetical protein
MARLTRLPGWLERGEGVAAGESKRRASPLAQRGWQGLVGGLTKSAV